jgi:hypothetical protein
MLLCTIALICIVSMLKNNNKGIGPNTYFFKEKKIITTLVHLNLAQLSFEEPQHRDIQTNCRCKAHNCYLVNLSNLPQGVLPMKNRSRKLCHYDLI